MSILTLFRDVCTQHPEKIAIRDRENICTYQELDQKSNVIAQLILNKIGPHQPVLLFLEPSLAQIIVLLGVLKARCYYIPCDVRLTAERLNFILHNSDTKLIISDRDCIFSAPIICHVETINIKKLDFALPCSSFDLLGPNEHDLAYVIYTSGTTGQPKGVKISHGNLSALFASTKKVFTFSNQDNWAYVHSYGFDFSVWEIWGALTTGATLILFSYEIIISPELFVNALLNHKISVLNQTPSAFYRIKDSLLSRIQAQTTPHLRYIIFGGEKLETSNLQSWINFGLTSSYPILVNMYGITEGTVHCTFSLVQAASASQSAKSIIGKPLEGYQFYLLPVEAGHELLIAGPAVCQGYIKCPDLEKEKFIQIEHTHYFRTGDLVQQLGDQLEYIGRFDDQVKIRGYRITLGEINHYLGTDPNIQSAVTVPIANEQDMQLVSFVTLTEQAQGSLQQQYQTQVSNWEYIYEQLYAHDFKQENHTFNIQGWNNSLTNQPFSAIAMQEWLQDTLEKIKSLQPKSVLEIGCGSGLILFGLLNEVETYCGIDISQQAIRQLQSLIPQPHVSLYVAEALHFDAIPDLKNKKFDCIIINSVVQYFPSIQYLRSLLKKLPDFLNSQASLFLGDIRNYQLLPEYHYYVARHRSRNLEQSLEQIHEQTYTGVVQEKELLISPDFFKYEVPKLLALENACTFLYRKQNTLENELNLFRYDVIIKTGQRQGSELTLIYDNGGYQTLSQRIKQINFAKEIWVVSCLDRTLTELSCALKAYSSDNLSQTSDLIITIPELKNLADHHHLQTRYLLNLKGSGHFEVLFYRGTCPDIALTESPQMAIQYANHPIEIEHDIFANLRKKLPFYAIPNYIHVLDFLPTTDHGKVDKRKLIAFHQQQSYLHTFIPKEQDSGTENKSHLQSVLMAIWKKVLKLKTLDLKDDFFEIGGDSISSLQIVHCCKQVGLQITIRDLFKYRTIGNLLAVIEKQSISESNLSLPSSHFKLSLIQDWFLQSHQGNIHEYSQSFLIELQPHVDAQIWLNVLKTVFANRATFKIRFKQHCGEWVQFFDSHASVMIYPEFISVSDPAHIANQMQVSKQILNIEHGYGAYVHFFVEDTRRYCGIAIHHLLIDAISWKLLLDDINTGYLNAIDYQHQLISPERMHYGEYVSNLNQIPVGHLLEDLTFWLSQLGPNFFAQTTTHYAKTRYLVQSFPIGNRPLHTSDAVAMQIAALYLSLRTIKKQDIVLTIEKHGREEFIHPQIESSIGWHTSLFPLKLNFSEQHNHAQLVEEIKKLFLAIPHGGVTFLAAKQQGLLPLSDPTFTSDISFNFLGNFDNSFHDHTVVKQVSPLIATFNQIELTCPFTLQVNTVIENNHLFVHFIYDEQITEQLNEITESFQRYLKNNILSNQYYPYPLTSMQNYLQTFADFPFQFHQLAMTLQSPISRDHLEQALLIILQQHDIFNMRFQNGQQYVCTDAKQLGVTEHWVEKIYPDFLQNVLLTDIQKPFYADKDYLLRLNIIHSQQEEQIILLTYHQYVLDGWALQHCLSLWSSHIIALEQSCPSPYLAGEQDLYLNYLDQLPRTQPHFKACSPTPASTSALAILCKRYGSQQNRQHAYGKVIHTVNLQTFASLQAFCSTQKITMGSFLMTALAYFLAESLHPTIHFKTIEAGRLQSDYDHTLGALTRIHPIWVSTQQPFNQAVCHLSNQLLSFQETEIEIACISAIQQDELVVSFQNFKKNADLATHFANRALLQFISLERSNTPMTIRFVPSEHLEIWVSYQESHFTEGNVKKMCEEFVKNMVGHTGIEPMSKRLSTLCQ